MKPVVFLISQGYTDLYGTHHVIDDQNNEESLFNVEFYMNALSTVATVIRITHAYKPPQDAKIFDSLRVKGAEESKKMTDENFIRFKNSYNAK